MKYNIDKIRNLFRTFLLSLGITLSDNAPAPTYRLCWMDDFTEREFNEDSWSKIPRGISAWNRYMSEDSSLYKVDQGRLILRGCVNEGSIPSDTAQYLTGGLSTQGKRTIRYGKVEVKARVHGAKGAWPAIWMLPSNDDWPKGGEIDLMERLNYDVIAYQTVHSYYTYTLKQTTNPPNVVTSKIYPNHYNIYAVEILPNKLVFSINGKTTLIYPKIETDKEGQYPFGTPFYLLIDMQMGGSWAGKVEPSDFPVEMEIDWVKMYDLEE